MKKFPEKGRTESELLSELKDRKKVDLKWAQGRAFSYVYYAEQALTDTLKKAYIEYFSENALNPSAFPSLRNMEVEVIQMCLDLFQGTKEACGSMTSGGTESILMALKSAKEYAKIHSPHIKNPQVILPISAHPAFDKGCDYFGLDPIKISVKEDFRVDVEELRKAITSDTILLVGSAPSYPQGVVDPIDEIGQLALDHNLLFHVDACVGGFVLPFIENFSKPWNLSVPGVTSLSADIHKYGMASKGSSVILYNSAELRKAQFYVYTGWPGGMYGSPAVLGTKPGGAIAVAWTVLQRLGHEGYRNLVKKNMSLANSFQEYISSYPKLQVFGSPDMCIFSFGSDEIDIYQLGDEMQVKGWQLDRQQHPAALHISVSPVHEYSIEDFKVDFNEAYAKSKKHSIVKLKTKMQLAANKGLKKILPSGTYDKVMQKMVQNSDVNSKRSAALYGLIGDLEGEGEVDQLIREYLDKLMK